LVTLALKSFIEWRLRHTEGAHFHREQA